MSDDDTTRDKPRIVNNENTTDEESYYNLNFDEESDFTKLRCYVSTNCCEITYQTLTQLPRPTLVGLYP